MSFFFAYLIKFSISLAAVYLFYRFVLRRLTFYNWNRWYLLGYTLLSFFIAAINITPLLQQNQLADNKTIQWVPALDLYGPNAVVSDPVSKTSGHWSAGDWTLFILIAGTIILLIRLLIQYLSFLRIRSKAQLISDNGMRIYQVNDNIIPFSFGNSIFINQQLHTEEELQEIIRHEFVHVKQRHSVDILWGELLCILNWYNPFAWLLCHAIRQNLEFIADHKVISHGVDRRQYQYLLLKVIGNNHFSIASKFNFSSLKKRIAMMNKMKSAGVHIVKFLFILPLIAVLLVAFRKDRPGKQQQDPLERSSVKPGITQATYIDTVPFVVTPNSKGYLIDVIGVNGECTVVIKDKKGKELERVTLNKWKEEKKYEQQYGEILPPPPSPDAIVAARPLDPLAPLDPLKPLDPIKADFPLGCPVNDLAPPAADGINLNGISREYEITNKKALLKLLDGTIEEYDLTNKKEKEAFEKKYGRIIHLNTNVSTTVAPNVVTNLSTNINTAVATNLNTNLKTNVNTTVATNLNTNLKTNLNTNVNTVISIPSPKAAAGSNLITTVTGSGLGTAVAPVAISEDGIISAVSSTTPQPAGIGISGTDFYSHIITGKEDIVITITKNTTRQELDKFIQDMKAKGVDLDFDDIEYNQKGKLVNITGNMRSGGSHSNFIASDFDQLVLAMIKKGDQVYFKVSVKEKEVI